MKRRKNNLTNNENLEKKIRSQENCPTFDEAVSLFLKEQRLLNRTSRTLEWHQENFHVLKKAFSQQGISLNNLNFITSDHLKDHFVLYALNEFKNKASTINNRLKTFRSFWRFLVNKGFIETEITKEIEPLKETKKVITTLD